MGAPRDSPHFTPRPAPGIRAGSPETARRKRHAVAAGYAPGLGAAGGVHPPARLYCGLYGLDPPTASWAVRASWPRRPSTKILTFARTVEDLALLLSFIRAPTMPGTEPAAEGSSQDPGPWPAASLRGGSWWWKRLDAMRSSVDPEVRLVLENTLNICRKEGARRSWKSHARLAGSACPAATSSPRRGPARTWPSSTCPLRPVLQGGLPARSL